MERPCKDIGKQESINSTTKTCLKRKRNSAEAHASDPELEEEMKRKKRKLNEINKMYLIKLEMKQQNIMNTKHIH